MKTKKCTHPNGAVISLGGFPVDPCQYEVIEAHENCTVEISRCKVCGNIDISWKRNKEDT